MLDARTRGLANLFLVSMTLGVGTFFWLYAEIIYLVPFVRLSHTVNLLPYYLCVIGGMALSVREVYRIGPRLPSIEFADGARLATRQVGMVALLTFAMMFATQDHRISRAFLGSFLLWAWIGLAWLNFWVPRRFIHVLFRRKHRLPTIFVGNGLSLTDMHSWIAVKERLGFATVGFLSDEPILPGNERLPAVYLGKVSDLDVVLGGNEVSQVVLLDFPQSDAEANATIDCCSRHGCRLLIRNNLETRFSQPLIPVAEDGHNFYALQEEPLEDPLNRLLKRTYDLVIAIPVVVFLLPVLTLAVWVMQTLESRGPLFHARERRGFQGKVFKMLKFRSMKPAPEDATAEAKQAETVDERIFPFGRFMRRTSLDEFPQFLNVLRGEMSIVGPRPYMPLLDESFKTQAPGYRARYLAKPGITGLAQSLGLRGAVLEQEMIQRRLHWDVHYVSNWSIWLDLQITARTLLQVIRPPKTAF